MIDVVLYEPEIPPNTGNAIRLCANAGIKLHLIKPLGFRLDDKSLQRSRLDYHQLADVAIHENLGACLAALEGRRLFAVETGGRRRYSDLACRPGDAFIFGPETRGLPIALQERIGTDNSLFIPMRPGSRSINLANAVAIVAFEAWRQLNFAGSDSHRSGGQIE
ncbi:MAG: tRNA (cytidine(34)-2'-O)-methyltransferase [Pseudomonadota bacterium]|nr:tRNA (cytidine(34)-2'-O)-methyltransferase [Pseudomonadota bacterium]